MRKKQSSKEAAAQRFLDEVRRARAGRSAGARPEDVYRERALKILPWVCAKCARDFTGKDLRDLTVHHKDHDHRNNPADGSNWELLCTWCHEDEHGRKEVAAAYGSGKREVKREASTYQPFAGLAAMLGTEGEDPERVREAPDAAGSGGAEADVADSDSTDAPDAGATDDRE